MAKLSLPLQSHVPGALQTSRRDSGFLARVAGTCSEIDKFLETSITLNITEYVSQRDRRHRKAAVP